MLISKRYDQLGSDEVVLFHRLLATAGSDEFIGREYVTWINSFDRFVLYFLGSAMVGFTRPFEMTFDHRVVHRSGTVYLLPEYRGSGIMFGILKLFYKTHRPAVAWINESNLKSATLYGALGFRVSSVQGMGSWWVLD